MEHRHLNVDPQTPARELGLAALDDILDRGDLADWRPVLAEIRRDPHGLVADRVLQLAASRTDRAGSELWRSWIAGARANGRAPHAGAALKRLRVDRGVTQQELADRLGLTQPEVSRLERRDDLKLSAARRYVRALGGELLVAARFGRSTVRLDRESDH